MKAFLRVLFALGFAASVIQCRDREAPLSVDPSTRPLETASTAKIASLIEDLFREDEEAKPRAMFKLISRSRSNGDLRGARKTTFQLIEFVLAKYEAKELVDPNGSSSPPTTEEAMAELIARLLEFVGLSGGPIPPGAFEEDGAFERCGQGGCVVVTGTGFAGVSIPPGALDHPVFIAISRLPNTPGQLPTNKDQYPTFYDFKILPEEDLNETFDIVGPTAEFDTDVSVALCVLDNPPHPLGAPPSVVPNLALAHPDESGEDIEILPAGPSGFIDCTDANTALRSGPWNHFLASLFRPITPRLLYAAPGDIGGQASSFSPFGAVDTTTGGPIITTTTLDAEPDTVAGGFPDTLKATVSPAPLLSESPEVLFFDGSDTLGSAPTNAGGVAQLISDTGFCEVQPCLPTGSHSVSAEFTGTPSHAGSTSSSVPVLVLPPIG